MKKSLIFLSFFTLLYSACTFSPQPQPIEKQKILTGLMTQVPTHNKDGIPYCKPYQLKPLQTWDIIKIDDVVQDCKIYTGSNSYSNLGLGGIHNVLYLTHEGVFEEAMNWRKEVLSCHGLALMDTRPEFDTVKNFIFKHQIHKKMFFRSFFPDFIYDESDYFCEQNICKKLVWKNRGENQYHYFFVGQKDIAGRDFLLLDDKIYDLGQAEYLGDHISLLKEGSWIIQKLNGDILKVAKLTDGELYKPYASNPELLNYDDFHTKVATFNIQECEILLGS